MNHTNTTHSQAKLRHTRPPYKKTGRSLASSHGGQLGSLFLDVLHVSDHVEGVLWEIVELARKQLSEVRDARVQVHELTSGASEDLRDEERLGEEALHLAGARDGKLILLGKLVHTKDGNNVLKRLVILEHLLSGSSNGVVLLTHD